MADISTPISANLATQIPDPSVGFSPLTPASPAPPTLPPDVSAVQKALADIAADVAKLKAGSKLSVGLDVLGQLGEFKSAVAQIKPGWKSTEFYASVLPSLGDAIAAMCGHDLGPVVHTIVGSLLAIYAVCRTYHKSSQ